MDVPYVDDGVKIMRAIWLLISDCWWLRLGDERYLHRSIRDLIVPLWPPIIENMKGLQSVVEIYGNLEARVRASLMSYLNDSLKTWDYLCVRMYSVMFLAVRILAAVRFVCSVIKYEIVFIADSPLQRGLKTIPCCWKQPQVKMKLWERDGISCSVLKIRIWKSGRKYQITFEVECRHLCCSHG
jgi:hypothetical protein